MRCIAVKSASGGNWATRLRFGPIKDYARAMAIEAWKRYRQAFPGAANGQPQYHLSQMDTPLSAVPASRFHAVYCREERFRTKTCMSTESRRYTGTFSVALFPP